MKSNRVLIPQASFLKYSLFFNVLSVLNLEKGDKVITSGGVHGVIAGLDEKTALLQVSENLKMKIERSAITTVLAKKGE